MAGSPYPGSVHKFPQLFHFNAAELHSWRDSVGYPAQMEQYPGGLKHYGYVCNIDWNMWLTVRGGAYSSPHYCLFLLLWTLMAVLCWCVCVCVEKAARRAECQPSAHVVNIRNQTAANRLQVRPAMAFTCTDTWQQQQAAALEGR